MKHTAKLITLSSMVVALVAAGLLLATGCSRGKSEASASASAEKNSFNQVTARLDRGGSLYAYIGTEQWLTNLHERMTDVRDVMLATPNLEAAERANIQNGFEIGSRIIQHSGVESVSGAGISRIALEPGFYRTRGFIHHYPDQGTGWLWNWPGIKPHPLDTLDCLPADTAWAYFFDLDMSTAWTAILRELHESGYKEAEAVIQVFNDNMERANGKKMEEMLASLAGQHGLLLTLDPTTKIPFPIGRTGPQEIPQPGLAFITKVKDDTLFGALDLQMKDNPMVTASEKNGVRMRTIAVPLLALFKIRPVLARTGDWLILASSEDLLWQLLDTKAGKRPGLKSSDEFKNLARDLATAQGNQFSYASKLFGETVMQIQKASMEANPAAARSQMVLLQKLFGAQPVTSFAVMGNTGDGWLSVVHSQ